MKAIRIYFEGDKRLRPGLKKFLGENSRIEVIAGKNKPETEKDFALGQQSHPDALVLLLVDADGPLSLAPSSSRFYMVQVMESWFLADREQLKEYFGQGFNAGSLPGSSTSVETIPKADVEQGLDDATRHCRSGKYSKDKAGHGRELLLCIDANKVRRAAPECNRLFLALAG